MKGHKTVKVQYSWTPPTCSFCSMFGHTFENCGKRPRSETKNVKRANMNNNVDGDNERFPPRYCD